MKVMLFAVAAIIGCTACNHRPHINASIVRQTDTGASVIILEYTGDAIQKSFDTLYNSRQTTPGIYDGMLEQAMAYSHYLNDTTDTITQDVVSSMYLNRQTGNYDCVTNTTFQFKDGSIAASGIFNLTPGDSIAPNHDFPITGGSAAYANIYGTYTRKYSNGIYHVALRYYRH